MASVNLLEIARMLQATLNETNELTQLFRERTRQTPASDAFLASLETVRQETGNCPVCLKEFSAADEELVKRLPRCCHYFHASCILPWLRRTNTCPMCRHEYPTDDFEKDEQRRLKEKEATREEMLEELHNSMFS